MKIPKLNCKIIGLRSLKGLDGVDYMLNKSDVALDYLRTDDCLEALWLEVDINDAKVRISSGYQLR